MRVYLDANIIMEYLAHRDFFDDVEVIFQASEQKLIEAYVSTMSIDSVTYLLGNHLKDKGIHEPKKRQAIREMLNGILSYIGVVDISEEQMKAALNDTDFTDIEDSYQYYCAKENDSDFLVTINIKDFKSKKRSETMEVLSPQDFVNKYME